MAALRIRRARPDEYDAVGALTVRAYARLPGFEADAAAYNDELADAAGRAATCEILVAVDEDDRLLGAVTYVPGPGPQAEFDDAQEAGIRMLAVDEAAARRGIGAALTRACLDRAEVAGRTVVVLHTSTENVPAQRLYGRLGFRRAPQRDLRTPSGTLLLGYEWSSGDVVVARRAPANGSRRAAPAHVDVRPVRPHDPRVAALIDGLMRELTDRYGGEDGDPFRPWDTGFTGAVLLATVGGEPAGTATLRPRGDDAEIKRMYVAPAHRGTGVGAALLAGIEDLARRRGHRRVVLETGTRQPEAMGLYAAASPTASMRIPASWASSNSAWGPGPGT